MRTVLFWLLWWFFLVPWQQRISWLMNSYKLFYTTGWGNEIVTFIAKIFLQLSTEMVYVFSNKRCKFQWYEWKLENPSCPTHSHSPYWLSCPGSHSSCELLKYLTIRKVPLDIWCISLYCQQKILGQKPYFESSSSKKTLDPVTLKIPSFSSYTILPALTVF